MKDTEKLVKHIMSGSNVKAQDVLEKILKEKCKDKIKKVLKK